MVLDSILIKRDGTISDLENHVQALKLDLEAAKKAQAGFMAVADRKTLEAEVVKSATSSILDVLKPF